MPEGEPQHEQPPRDISREFAEMLSSDFRAFCRALQDEPSLSITWTWSGIGMLGVIKARQVKAFLEGTRPGQKRYATIRATDAQHDSELNVFGSGVQWERI